MTKKEFYATIANCENIAGDIREYAAKALAAEAAAAERRRNTPTKAQRENLPLYESIINLLAEATMTSTEIATVLSITTQKAASLCKHLVENGSIAVESVADEKKGRLIKHYHAISAE